MAKKKLTLAQLKAEQKKKEMTAMLSHHTLDAPSDGGGGGGGGGLFGSGFFGGANNLPGVQAAGTLIGEQAQNIGQTSIGGTTLTQAATAAATGNVAANAAQAAMVTENITGVHIAPPAVQAAATAGNTILGQAGSGALSTAQYALTHPDETAAGMAAAAVASPAIPALAGVGGAIAGGALGTAGAIAGGALGLATAAIPVIGTLDTYKILSGAVEGAVGGGSGGTDASTTELAKEFKFGSRDKFRRLFRSGRGGTFLTGGQGVTGAAPGGGMKTLLGE